MSLKLCFLRYSLYAAAMMNKQYSSPLGHEHIEQRFSASLQQARLHHAWMLYGLSGIGKRMLAEHLAMQYLCESDGERACGQCHGCRMFKAGAHPDYSFVGRLEKKRDISVAQVRELQSFLALSGRESDKKVVVLDDADLMNLQAANALLKGLEEPPKGSLLIIVCHNLIALPATIRSRCMLEHCSPLGDEHMRHLLSSLPISEDALPMLLQLAQGCPGKVMQLQDETLLNVCLSWHHLVKRIEQADVALVQDWLQKHISLVPHDLIVAIVYYCVEERLQAPQDFAAKEQLFQALQQWLAWPKDVERHSLRAAPTLFSRYLDLRMVMKEVVTST